MSNLVVTANDLALIRQNHQIRYVKLQLLNKSMYSVGVIIGQLISGNVSIESGDNIRRSASITMKTSQPYVDIRYADIRLDLQRDVPANYYVRLWCGIEDNNLLAVSWYLQGTFIIDQSSYNFDATTGNLSLNLVDLMIDLNGDRAGQLHAYTSIVKNTQRIDETIENVLQIAGFTSYNICPITVLQPINTIENSVMLQNDDNEDSDIDYDYYIPYDLDFNAGVTAYEIIDKLVNLYPYYECGFDASGTFFVRKELLEQDSSFAVLDAYSLVGLVISENTSFNWSEVKNHIEVWGKDGEFYGEADDNNLESPFRVGATGLRTLVVTGNEYGIDTNAICDRYIDTSLAQELLNEQASIQAQIAALEAKESLTNSEQQELRNLRSDLEENKWQQESNISVRGNDLAREWAERILYDKSRLQDNVTIKTVCMPFLNDTDFKISYRSKVDDIVRNYVVKSISHDLSSGTTDINMIRFYNDQCVTMWEQLEAPVIVSAVGVGRDIVLSIEPVPHAETYGLYVNGIRRATYANTDMVYPVPGTGVGTYSIQVVAETPYYKTSELSEAVIVHIAAAADNVIIADDDSFIVTNDGINIKYSEG